MSETKSLALVPKSISEVESLAEILSKSTLLPDALRGKVPDVVVSILAGQELGLSPMAAIRGVHVVQGKPVLSADTMVGLVLGSGLAEYFTCAEETAERVTYETRRKGSAVPQRFTWSDDDTKAAGLNTKENWRLYKRQMRRARCKAVLARDVYPDVLAGCYDNDEIQVAAQPSRAPLHVDITDAEVLTDNESEIITSIDAAPDTATLEAMLPTLTKLDEPTKARARERYTARKAKLANGTNPEPAA